MPKRWRSDMARCRLCYEAGLSPSIARMVCPVCADRWSLRSADVTPLVRKRSGNRAGNPAEPFDASAMGALSSDGRSAGVAALPLPPVTRWF